MVWLIVENSLDSRGPLTRYLVYAWKVAMGTLKNTPGLETIIPY